MIPIQIDFLAMDMGTAIILIGVYALLFAAIVILRTWVTGLVWSFSLLFLLLSNAINIHAEYVWLALILTGTMLVIEFAIGVGRL